MKLDLYEFNYRQGYERALCDVKNWFERHSMSMKDNRLNNSKGMKMLIDAFVKYADDFRELGDDTEFVLTEDRNIVISRN